MANTNPFSKLLNSLKKGPLKGVNVAPFKGINPAPFKGINPAPFKGRNFEPFDRFNFSPLKKPAPETYGANSFQPGAGYALNHTTPPVRTNQTISPVVAKPVASPVNTASALPRYLGSADSLETKANISAGLPSSPVANQQFSPVGLPQAPNVDLRDLYGLLSPGISQAYDAVSRVMNERQAKQQAAFSGIGSNLADAFKHSGADFGAASHATNDNINHLADMLGISGTLNSLNNGVRQTQDARLENLSSLFRQGEMSNLGTLGEARNQIFDTAQTVAAQNRAGGLQGLAETLANAQAQANSGIAGTQAQAIKDWMEQNLQAQKFQQEKAMNELLLQIRQAQLAKAQLAAAGGTGNADVTQEQSNPGLNPSIMSIQNPLVKSAATGALYNYPTPSAAVTGLYNQASDPAINAGLFDESKNTTGQNLWPQAPINQFHDLLQPIMSLPAINAAAMQYFLPYDAQRGGVNTKVSSKNLKS